MIPAGVPRKPGMTRDDLFNTNAGIVKTLVEGCGRFAPDAVLAIISNPVRSRPHPTFLRFDSLRPCRLAPSLSPALASTPARHRCIERRAVRAENLGEEAAGEGPGPEEVPEAGAGAMG